MIELKDVVLAYEDRYILNHVNLTIHDGETVAIVGGSGAGKSTLLKLVIGLLKPTSGHIYVDGIDITNISDREFDTIRQQMGMVFQYSALFDSMTVAENVAFGLRQHTKLTDYEIQAVVKEKLALVGLPHTESYMPSELSGGMKKRISLARAIALEPHIILYDEPTSGLDPVTSGTISRLIRSMQEHLQCSSIVVTHDMESACYVADRIAFLEAGQFIEVSRTEEFKRSKHPKVQQFITGGIYTSPVNIEEGHNI